MAGERVVCWAVREVPGGWKGGWMSVWRCRVWRAEVSGAVGARRCSRLCGAAWQLAQYAGGRGQ